MAFAEALGMAKYILLIFLGLQTAWAQQDMYLIEPNSPRPYAEQSGQLFTVGVALDTGELTVRTVGKPVVDTDFSDLMVLGRTFDLTGNKKQLRILKSGDHFRILDKIGDSSEFEIQVRNPKRQQDETL